MNVTRYCGATRHIKAYQLNTNINPTSESASPFTPPPTLENGFPTEPIFVEWDEQVKRNNKELVEPELNVPEHVHASNVSGKCFRKSYFHSLPAVRGMFPLSQKFSAFFRLILLRTD